MENPAQYYDAVTLIGRLSVQQDFFWFFSLLFWSLAMILWWRHPQRRNGWAWLPGAGFMAVWTAMLQFGMYNPTFDFFQDRLIPGTVSNYRPALVDPYWFADVLMGTVLAAMPAMWGWLAARGSGRQHLRWLSPIGLVVAVALHIADPGMGAPLIALLTILAALALWPQVRDFSPAKYVLILCALLPLSATVGPVAAAMQVLQRSGPPTPMGLAAAASQLLVGLVVLRSLSRGLPQRLPAETRPAFRRDTLIYAAGSVALVLTGLLWAIQVGRDNRLEIQQNRLRTAAAHAKVFDPALLAPLESPDFHIDWKSPAGESAPAHVPWLENGVLEPARHRLAEVVIATPFLDHARLLVIRDGWLLSPLSSTRDSRTGEVEVLRRATPEDLAQWERKEPYVEESPVPEIGYAYYCRAPIVAPDGRMLGWLDCVRREYYLSVERRWRAAPFLVTALGIVLLTLVFLQRQIGREREIAFRDAAVAAERNRVKTTFLANVSHELRTPLQSILGYSELLSPDLPDEKSRAQLAALRQQGELMTRLINDLIDLSAVESGSFQLALRPAAPAELVRQTVESLRPRAAAKGLALEAEIDGGVPAWVQADGGRWRQVLVNLVGNAIKFTDRGRVVVALRAEATSDDRIDLVLAVSDTGPGIPPAQQGRLFAAFSRLEPTAAKEGSGLGLALSAALCRAMDGDLGVSSDGVTGSCFTARIRVTEAAAPVAVSTVGVIPAGFAPRVLVVDDNRLVRELFVAALDARGARVRSAGSGAEGLAQIAEDRPEVLVLDLALPDGDGTEFVPRFRGLVPQLRIIGVSAHAGVADRDRALAAGMDAFLVKPVALDALWTAVAGVSTAPAAPAAGFELPAPLRDRLRAEFARELPAQRASLAAAVQAGDWSAVYARAHYLRNSALVVQASDLFTACTALEAAAAGQNAPLVRDCWARCRALIDPLVPNVPGRA